MTELQKPKQKLDEMILDKQDSLVTNSHKVAAGDHSGDFSCARAQVEIDLMREVITHVNEAVARENKKD